MIIFDIYSEVLDGIKKIVTNPVPNCCFLNELGTTASFQYNSLYSNRKKRYESTKDIELYFAHGGVIYSVKRSEFRKALFDKIHICPYCGKSPFIARESYTKNGNKRLYSFELDHFLKKSEYPQFALSVYNLIPVCKTCNQFIKGQKDYKNGHYFHPYVGWIDLKHGSSGGVKSITKISTTSFDDVFSFQTNFRGNGRKVWKTNGVGARYYRYTDYLMLDELYKNSKDTLNDYAAFLNIKGVIVSAPNVYRTKDLFKNWYPKTPAQILSFSNGKMKQDLVKSLRDSLIKKHGGKFNF